MIVISPTELRSNLKKYLDIAKNEKVVIQRGRTDMFELTKKERIITDEDLKNAITGKELIDAVIKRIKTFPEK